MIKPPLEKMEKAYFKPGIITSGAIVTGKQTCTVGRVSMDMLYVDITNIPSASISSDVELWGEHIPVDEVAEKSGTVGYELLCAISASKRVPIETIYG